MHQQSFPIPKFLNQACAGCKPVCTWFLKIALSVNIGMYVCLCVCVPAPKAMNNLNKFYSCYMATLVCIIGGRGLGIHMHRIN